MNSITTEVGKYTKYSPESMMETWTRNGESQDAHALCMKHLQVNFTDLWDNVWNAPNSLVDIAAFMLCDY